MAPRFWLLALFSLAAGPIGAHAQIRIAVLPWTVEGSYQESEAGEEVSGLLIYELIQSEGVEVLDAQSVATALDMLPQASRAAMDNAALRSLGVRLGATHLVRGAVSGAGDRMGLVCDLVDVDTGASIAVPAVKGIRGDLYPLAQQLAGLILERLEFQVLSPTVAPYVDFQEEYELTPRDLQRSDGNHGYTILHRDPLLGWELGAACYGSGAAAATMDVCRAFIFIVSDRLEDRWVERGRDGYWVWSFNTDVGSSATVYHEVKLQGLDRVLTFRVDLLGAEISRGFHGTDRLPVILGARKIQVRVRLTG